MSHAVILPDSRTKAGTGQVQTVNGWETPIYCALCHTGPAGWCPVDMPFLFYVCTPCFEANKDTSLLNVAFMPDEVFFKQVEEAQIEKYGHALSEQETIIMLADPESLESTLARSRQAMTPKASA